MPASSNHIIHKVSLDITVKNEEQAYALKDNISTFFAEEVFPELELYLEQLQKETEQFAIRLEEVSLDFSFPKLELNTVLKEEIIATFKERIKNLLANQWREQTQNRAKELNSTTGKEENTFNSLKISPRLSKKSTEKSSPQFFSQDQHQLATLIHFIEHGSSPWWQRQGEDTITALLESNILHSLITIPFFKTQLVKLLPLKNVQKRLLYQFSITHLFSIVTLFISDANTLRLIEHIRIHDFSVLSKTQKDAFFLIIFNCIQQQENIDAGTILTIAKKLSFSISMLPDNTELKKSMETINSIDTHENNSQNNTSNHAVNPKNNFLITHEEYTERKSINSATNTTAQENNNFTTLEERYQYTEKELLLKNAGLVLAHPFLPHLFKHCELLDAQKQITNPELAVHILHYLATGNTQQAESDLLFEKYLCNVPFEIPIPRFIDISVRHIEHVHKLLDAIKQNWSAMRTSSHGLLRNEFLQRSGKLTFKNDNTTVTIERKTHDILLNKISWGISLMRLPWKKGFIYVHWN